MVWLASLYLLANEVACSWGSSSILSLLHDKDNGANTVNLRIERTAANCRAERRRRLKHSARSPTPASPFNFLSSQCSHLVL